MTFFQEVDGLWWLLLLLGPFLLLQRKLHHEIQAVILLITRRADITITLFSLIFFPGVFLHEISHYLMATILGVRTGKVSLIPAPQPGGRLQLGYVETASADILRDALIGFAPLLSGGLFIAFAGLQMRLPAIWVELAQTGQVGDAFILLLNQPDFWLWFYLAFTVSSTMLPSATDRRAWLPLTIAVGILLAISLIAGAGPWMAAKLLLPVNQALRGVAIVFGIGASLHSILLLPVFLLRRGLNRLTGLEVA